MLMAYTKMAAHYRGGVTFNYFNIPVFVTFLEKNFYTLIYSLLAIELLVIWVTRRIFVPCLSTNPRINPALPAFAFSKNGVGTMLW